MPEFIVQGLESPHWVKSTTGDGHLEYTLTGVVVLTAIQGTGSDWLRQRVSFTVPIPDLPGGTALHLVHWAPFVALSSISNANQAINAGWAVDSFGIDNAGEPQRGGVSVYCNVAVRDSDGFIARLAYVVQLVGDPGPV